MHGVLLEDGLELRAYKHHRNRRYLHLSGDGRAFVFVHDGNLDNEGAYRPVDLAFALWLVRVMNFDEDRGCRPLPGEGYLANGDYVHGAYPR